MLGTRANYGTRSALAQLRSPVTQVGMFDVIGFERDVSNGTQRSKPLSRWSWAI